MSSPSLLLLPGVSGMATTVVEPLSAADAMGAIIESSTLVVVDELPARGEHLEVLRRTSDAVRAWRVASGLDLLADPAGACRRLLGETAG